MSSKQVDIVIVGAGMVGLTIANLLASLPLKIAVIEAHEIPEWKLDEHDLRVSAVSPASQQVLQDAGAWEAISSSRVSPYKNMQIWEQAIGGSDELHFSATDMHIDALGCIVENSLIRHALKLQVDTHNNVSLLVPDRLEKISVSEKIAEIELHSGMTIKSKLVIAADGANSITRRKLGISEASRSYDQYGVVAQLRPEKSHHKTAYQRFHNGQVLGLLPLENGDLSMVWSCSTADADRYMKLSKESLAEALAEFSQNVLGQLQVISEVKKFPLQLLHSKQYVSQRVVLCGDAAHAVHPLAGQGVNLGFLDVAVLFDVIKSAWEKNFDLGDLSVLRQYERQRKHNNVQMMSGMDALFAMYQSENPLIQQIRRFGMGLIDRITPVKKQLIEQALGLKSL